MASHTLGHINCPACDARRAHLIEPATFGALRFWQAAPIWLRDRQDEIAPKTKEQYELYIRTLGKFFDQLTLSSIHIGHIDEYAAERLESVGASLVRHEINTLAQVMDRAGLWTEIAKFYKPPKLKKSKAGKAIAPEQEERLLAVAASHPRWKVAYWGWLISRTTTAGPGEITHLHLNDVDLGEKGTLHIRDGIKNDYRERYVTLNETSRWAVGQMLKRYYRIVKKLGINPDPEHYILPGRRRGSRYDPTLAMGSWKKAWQALRAKADLENVRAYDGRHLAITALLEDKEVPERVVIDMAGHVSKRMLNEYSHIRLDPKRAATAKLEVKRPPASVPVEQSVDTSAEIRATKLKVGL